MEGGGVVSCGRQNITRACVSVSVRGASERVSVCASVCECVRGVSERVRVCVLI